MTYKELLKNHIKLTKLGNLKLSKDLIGILCCQYNPDRFNIWKSVFCEGYKGSYLSLLQSPHVTTLQRYADVSKKEFAKDVRFSRYCFLQMLYNNDDMFRALKRCDKLIELYEDIKASGINETPILLDSPIVESNHNASDYEIYEGHHRLACAYVLDIDCECDVYSWERV